MHTEYISDVMLLGTLLLFTVLSEAAAQDCTTKIQQCINIFMDNMALHPKNSALVCLDTNVFVKCANEGCQFNESQIAEIMAAAQRDLASIGFQCVVNINTLTTFRPQTMNPRTVEPATCDAAVTSCTRAYLNDVIGQTKIDTGNQQICPLIERYVTCLISSPCEAQLIRSNIKNNIESELERREIQCKLNIAEKLSSAAPRQSATTTRIPRGNSGTGNSGTTQRNSILAASITTVSSLLVTAALRHG